MIEPADVGLSKPCGWHPWICRQWVKSGISCVSLSSNWGVGSYCETYVSCGQSFHCSSLRHLRKEVLLREKSSIAL
jgi:hypothetical protein